MLAISLLGAAPALWCLALAGLPHEGVRKHKLRVAEARWASGVRMSASAASAAATVARMENPAKNIKKVRCIYFFAFALPHCNTRNA